MSDGDAGPPSSAGFPLAFEASRVLKFSDCDPTGIAYFPTYLDLLVGVVEEFFGSLGIPWSALVTDRRIGCPTVRINLDFIKPGLFGERLDFRLHIRAVRRVSLELEHRICRGDILLWTASQTIVATSLDTHRAISWPKDVRAALTGALERQENGRPASY